MRFKAFDVDAVAMRTKKVRCNLKAPVFPLPDVASSSNMAEFLALDAATALVILHVPSARPRVWTSFLHCLWQACADHFHPCLVILDVNDDWLPSPGSSGTQPMVVKSTAGFSSDNPCFRRLIVTIHLPDIIPKFVQLPFTVTYSQLELHQGTLPRPWVAAIVCALSGSLGLNLGMLITISLLVIAKGHRSKANGQLLGLLSQSSRKSSLSLPILPGQLVRKFWCHR